MLSSCYAKNRRCESSRATSAFKLLCLYFLAPDAVSVYIYNLPDSFCAGTKTMSDTASVYASKLWFWSDFVTEWIQISEYSLWKHKQTNSNFAQARSFAIALVESLLIGQVAPAKKRANVEATLCWIAYHIDIKKNTLTWYEHITMPQRVFQLSGSAQRILAPFQKPSRS